MKKENENDFVIIARHMRVLCDLIEMLKKVESRVHNGKKKPVDLNIGITGSGPFHGENAIVYFVTLSEECRHLDHHRHSAEREILQFQVPQIRKN